MRPGDDDWLEAELRRLLSFGTTAQPGEWLDDDGIGEPGRARETWLAARSLHVRSLGVLEDVPGSRPLAQAALEALAGPLRDADHGGWHARLAQFLMHDPLHVTRAQLTQLYADTAPATPQRELFA